MTTIAHLHYTLDLDFYHVDLQEAGDYLARAASQYSNLIFRQQTKIDIDFDEGSLKANIIVGGLIYLLANYGSVRSSVDYFIKDAKSLQQLITSDLIKSGLDEKLILKKKRVHCAPDRIRKILLAIERLEAKENLSPVQYKKELSRIKSAVANICSELSEEDADFFITSINDRYRPRRHGLPQWNDPFRVAAREEDLKSPSRSFPPRVKEPHAEALTTEWTIPGPSWF
ncbi:hypothetical protein [Stutzerimonas stutzeri]|uniref:hypothetical protein n=1 Tax=Stutzerimonas stutzeri TaxID=316 RepID=UPI000F76FEC7|nr:hypothetical protein [Stutzerimonas stutzeri]RTM16294.1 hypothetical protein EKN22_19515 [Stutzerimonas stutzeri]